ncbi:LPXTG cell wall anchor domain-containing protein [Desulfovibrio sp. OttesenSCG-928-G11]|nr:LPXTG cell wall anchor domain-containing protein [Desulfovibrio sp. OttesenSCG-928-G11]
MNSAWYLWLGTGLAMFLFGLYLTRKPSKKK